MRATRAIIEQATALLKQGKGPAAVVAATGISLETAKKLYRQISASLPPTLEPIKMKPDYASQCGPVSTRKMTPEEIKHYGLPMPHPEPIKVRKEFRIVIGPVAADRILHEVQKAIKIMKLHSDKAIITITTALKEENQNDQS